VCLTSQICKLFEAIVKDNMVEFLETHKLLSDTQHGFRKGRSCLSSLLAFLEKVLRHIDEGCSIDVVFLDMAKAFDKVPHKRLLEILRKHGIGGKILRILGNWLQGRKQRVCVLGKFSESIEVLSGEPHGSILGPLLFLIFMNDLESGVVSHILKFADDFKIFGKVVEVTDVNQLEKDLDVIVDWTEKWQMKMNTDKCKVMHIGGNNANHEYSMLGHKLQVVEREKDLGIMLSSDMKSVEQCMYAANRANRALGMIKRTIRNREPEIMVKLYKAIVRPHLEYCVSAWNPHYSKNKELMERVQRRFTKMVNGLGHLPYTERCGV